MWRVTRPGETVKISNHVARVKRFHPQTSFAEPDVDEIESILLGEELPEPDTDIMESPVSIGPTI